jgi:hypothetical protein
MARRLRTVPVHRASSFEDLYSKVDDAIGQIRGIGPLLVYDTTLRLGARANRCPKLVYLHAGARAGARVLLNGPLPRTQDVSQFPAELQDFEPVELEDLLCIFKSALERVAR